MGSGMDAPKYALFEIERRMLADAALLPDLRGLPCKTIEDRYLDAGRLRLRRITDADGTNVVYKLCKKYGSQAAYQEPIVNIYLTQEEYEALRVLPGYDLTKRRYAYEYEGHRFSIDELLGPRAGLYLCEHESASVPELLAATFPPFAVEDVTTNPNYSGIHLAHCRQMMEPINRASLPERKPE